MERSVAGIDIKEPANPDLKRLLQLQQMDLESEELEGRLAEIPLKITSLEEQLRRYVQDYEESQKELDDNQKQRRQWEGDIQLLREKITKHKGQLYELKSNEQYRVMGHEIEGEEQRTREFEDRILEKMMDAEQCEKRIRESEAVLHGQKGDIDRQKRDLESALVEAQQHLEDLRKERTLLAESIGASILGTYHAVRNFRSGPAVVEAQDGLCTGCNVRLRPQAFNDIQTNQQIITCESCNRILYFRIPEAEPAAPKSGAHAGAKSLN